MSIKEYDGVRYYQVFNYLSAEGSLSRIQETDCFYEALRMASQSPHAVMDTLTDGFIERSDYFTPKHQVGDLGHDL